jgi:hypothetical protein
MHQNAPDATKKMSAEQKKGVYPISMGKIESFSLRLEAEKYNRLKKLADSMGLKLVDMGRIAVDGLLDYADAHDGQVMLPIDFTRAWTELRAAVEEAEIEQEEG